MLSGVNAGSIGFVVNKLQYLSEGALWDDGVLHHVVPAHLTEQTACYLACFPKFLPYLILIAEDHVLRSSAFEQFRNGSYPCVQQVPWDRRFQ
jgi:hypothetical protein